MTSQPTGPPPEVDAQPAPGIPAALLLLTDGRFPTGGHAHSGGLEAAEALHGVRGLTTLESFLRGRLGTLGLVSAAFAAAAADALHHRDPEQLLRTLDLELDARTPSPAQRRTSRALGRQALRAGRACWPHPCLDTAAGISAHGPHQPIAFGAIAAAAGLAPFHAALAATHESVLGPATAAVRLLGLDPFRAHALVASLARPIEAVAAAATASASGPVAELPATSSPLLDLCAEAHAHWEVRLFAS